MRIAVIDDVISKQGVHFLTGKEIVTIDMISVRNPKNEPFNLSHGTICTSLLAEFCPNAEIIGVSTGLGEYEISVDNVCHALYWCLNHHVDIVSLSIGTTHWFASKAMNNITKQLAEQKVKIVSAVNPNGLLTFPACLPWVVGVMYDNKVYRTEYKTGKEMGYDVCVGYFQSEVLDRLGSRSPFFRNRTNSMAVPYAIGRICTETLPMTEAHSSSFQPMQKCLEFDNIPIINVKSGKDKSELLLDLFLQQGYMAVLISSSKSTDWSKMVLHISKASLIPQIQLLLAEASLIVLEIEEELERFFDIEVNLSSNCVNKEFQRVIRNFT